MIDYLTEEDFVQILRDIDSATYVTVDTEGTLNHPFAVTWGISISIRGVANYLPFNHRFGQNLPASYLPRLMDVLYRAPYLVMHHAKHDLRSLKALFGKEYTGKFYCTMMMSHWINENRYAQRLNDLSIAYGGHPKDMPEAAKIIIETKGWGWPYIPAELMASYASTDAYITEELFFKLLEEFQEQGFDGELWEIEQKFIRLMARIEDNGVLIDQELSERELEKGLAIMEDLQGRLGFNPGSPKQLGKFLLDDLQLPPVGQKNKKGNYSFDKHHMEVYDELLALRDDDRAKMVLTYRGWAKTTSSNYKPYLELLGPDGRLHANFKLHGTKTGRMSCENPNLQQIPKVSSKPWNGHLKDAFIVEQNRIPIEFDYSQLEFRLGAAYGREKYLLDIFADPSRDIFTEMAAKMGISRDGMKTMVYSMQFGAGVDRISDVFGFSRVAAKATIDNYWRVNSGIAKAKNLAAKRAVENGFVRYWTGRRRHFLFSSEHHKAFNALCQGGAFEIVKRRMVAVDDAGLNNDECRIDLQVHDSIRADIEEGKEHIYEPEIKRVMEDIQGFGVTFRVDSKRWGTKG